MKAGQGRGRCDRISAGAEKRRPVTWLHPGGHNHRPGEEEGPGRQSGVHKVFAYAAKQLLNDNDGKKVPHENGPVGNGHWAYESQQKAGDHSGEVPHRIVQLHNLPVSPFKKYTGCHRQAAHQQNPGAKGHHRPHKCRKQRQNDVQHQPSRPVGTVDMGRAGHSQLIKILDFTRHGSPSLRFGRRRGRLGWRSVPQLLLGGADAVNQRQAARAGIGTAAALHTVQHILPLQGLQVSPPLRAV